MKITTVYFSATNTTKKIITHIARKISSEVKYIDVTRDKLDKDLLIETKELLIVGMPVYGGRIPNSTIHSLEHLKGKHTPVILVSVYGNREYEDAFVEMQDILEKNGFFILAGAAFIAQHSIFPHTAQGRPDITDWNKINNFAIKCVSRIENGYTKYTKSIKLPGNHPYKIPGKIPLKVITNNKCTECGTCIRVCPVKAIPTNNPHHTDYDKCIHCGRCIYVCKNKARQYDGILYKIAGTIFGIKNRKRKEPEFFF